MMARSLALALPAAIVLAASVSWIPATTFSCADSEFFTGGGTVIQGSYLDTCYPDNVRQGLREAGVQKRLSYTWTFQNVPPGTHTLIVEGYRPNNSDGDNFQFYYNTVGGQFYLTIPGAVISSSVESGFTIPLGLTTTSWGPVYIHIQDTAGGTNLDSVFLDRVVIQTVP